MTFIFRPAVRENVPLLVGLMGGTGSGKTMSGLRLAKGMAGSARFAVIDTEAGRAKHYADQFQFDHGDLKPPFRPGAYLEAIEAADRAGYPVIVVDSMTHVWSGDGGVLDWQEEELDRMAGDNWQKREAVKMAAWIKPKMAHKQMVARLLQLRSHLILCFRAEEKMEMVRGDNGKVEIRKKETRTGLDGWVPVCEKNLPFELTMSFLLTADAPGMPKPIKLEQQHRSSFPLNQPINETAGEQLAAWAKGGAPVQRPEPARAPLDTDTGEIGAPEPTWTAQQLAALMNGSDLKMSDLSPVVGATVTRANFHGVIDQWLTDNPDKSLASLCGMAAAERDGRAPVTAGYSQPEQMPFGDD